MEISAPRVEEVKGILRRWEPFHCGASEADWLDNLYPHIYRVPVTLPASTSNEDFLQIIDNGIQVQNRNFVQSTELVK